MNISKTTILQFSIPAGLAIAAAMFHSMAIRKAIETDRYIVLSRDLQPGDQISDEDLEVRNVSTIHIPPGAIRYRDRNAVVGATAIRSVESDHLLMLDDIQIGANVLQISADEIPVSFPVDTAVVKSNNFHVGQHVHLQFLREDSDESDELANKSSGATGRDLELGPFRIVSIGSAITPYAESPDKEYRSIAVAVRKENPNRGRLVAAQDTDSKLLLRGIYSRPMSE